MKKTITLFTADQIAAVKSAFQTVICFDFTSRERKEADKWLDEIMHVASMNLLQAKSFDNVVNNFITKKTTKKTAVAKKTTTKTKKNARK